MKQVTFHGNTYTVGEQYNYITVDADGNVYAHEQKPTYQYSKKEWTSTNYSCLWLGHIDCMSI